MDGGNLILRKGANIQLNVTLNSILLLSRVNHLSKPNFCFYDNSTWLGKSDMQFKKLSSLLLVHPYQLPQRKNEKKKTKKIKRQLLCPRSTTFWNTNLKITHDKVIPRLRNGARKLWFLEIFILIYYKAHQFY